MRRRYSKSFWGWLFTFERALVKDTFVVRICGASLVIAFYPKD